MPTTTAAVKEVYDAFRKTGVPDRKTGVPDRVRRGRAVLIAVWRRVFSQPASARTP